MTLDRAQDESQRSQSKLQTNISLPVDTPLYTNGASASTQGLASTGNPSHITRGESETPPLPPSKQAKSSILLPTARPTTRTPKFIKKFPAELLHFIFKLMIPPNYLLNDSTSLAPNSLWSRAMAQKISVINVCRAWYRVGISFLYEHIFVNRLYTLPDLGDTLEDQPNLARLVKGINIACFIHRPLTTGFQDILGRVFQVCPNLRAFSYQSPCDLPRFNALPVLPAAITRLSLHSCISEATLDLVLEQTSKHLVSLSIPLPQGGIGPGTHAVSPPPILSFDCLQELRCEIEVPSAEEDLYLLRRHWKFPILQRLTFYLRFPNHPIGSTFITDLVAFCALHGRDITYLRIHAQLIYHYAPCASDFQPILDTCQSLKELVIYSGFFVLERLSHSKVTHIDIVQPPRYAIYPDANWDHPQAALGSMKTVRQRFPSLVHLRVFVPPTLDVYCLPDTLPSRSMATPDVLFQVEGCTVAMLPSWPDGGQEDLPDTSDTETDDSYAESSSSSESGSDSDDAYSDDWEAEGWKP